MPTLAGIVVGLVVLVLAVVAHRRRGRSRDFGAVSSGWVAEYRVGRSADRG